MVKSDFVGKVAEKVGGTKKDAAQYVDAFIATVMEAVSDGEKVAFAGFGSFEAKDVLARECRNPQTGEIIMSKEKRAPKFKAGKNFKDALN